jgi:DNA-binding transcriptional regulator YdaS (Cro superfamily)
MAKTLTEWLVAHGGASAKRELATRAALTWSTVHDIARGKRVPSVSTARRIEAATGGSVSAASLLGLDSVRMPDGGASPAAADAEPEAAE